ncbi:MAG: 16S rRNA (guanine(966)-N(2))-methyltransferase RsmD [Erysipelotrichales bacterium]|nr:16S rRNA (guanine(966)-N(2))-methyltransferase RsmD [Erysipelotrichales bacterium]
MRITAGKYRSRKLLAPEGESTRPTQDQVKEAVFSHLGGMFDEGRILDLFAGSGAIGFEAISRGMKFACINDRDPKAADIMRRNKDALKLGDEVLITNYDFNKSLKLLGAKGMKFDYIYLDPPYALEPYDKAMSKILQYDLLEENGIIIAESARDTEIQAEGYVCYKEAKYGVARIRYFRKGEE